MNICEEKQKDIAQDPVEIWQYTMSQYCIFPSINFAIDYYLLMNVLFVEADLNQQ